MYNVHTSPSGDLKVQNFFNYLGAAKWYFTYPSRSKNPWGLAGWNQDTKVALLLEDTFVTWATRVHNPVEWRIDPQSLEMVSNDGMATAPLSLVSDIPMTHVH